MPSLNPNALAEAQSSSEMFDVMCPPTAGFDVYKDRPVPTGESLRPIFVAQKASSNFEALRSESGALREGER